MVGKFGVLAAATYNYTAASKVDIDLLERRIPQFIRNKNFSYTIEKILIENILIEVLVLAKTTEQRTRWTIFSSGNGEFYQTKFIEENFFKLLDSLKSTITVFSLVLIHF